MWDSEREREKEEGREREREKRERDFIFGIFGRYKLFNHQKVRISINLQTVLSIPQDNRDNVLCSD